MEAPAIPRCQAPSTMVEIHFGTTTAWVDVFNSSGARQVEECPQVASDGERIVKEAQLHRGWPYVWGAPDGGFKGWRQGTSYGQSSGYGPKCNGMATVDNVLRGKDSYPPMYIEAGATAPVMGYDCSGFTR